MANTMKLTILEDGELEIETDEISPTVHKNADEFLKFLGELMGGEVKTTKLPHQHKRTQTTVKVGR